MNKTILLTGGTGFLGSFLAAKFLQKGYRVAFLARSRGSDNASSRIEKALKFAAPDFKLWPGQWEAIEGDVTEPNLGIKLDKRLVIKHRVDEIWHCAASVSFSKKERDLIFKINYEGTKNVLDFALKSGISRLHYVSTAYVSGDTEGKIFEDELDCGQKFYNSYEESKFLSEKAVRKAMGRLAVSVYRPSIIVGDSATGRTPTFTGYYGVFRGFYFILDRICHETDEKKRLYKDNGIFLKENGLLSLPVDIICDPFCTSSLVSVDFVVETIFSLALKKESAGRTFHLVHQKPPFFGEMCAATLKIIGLEDFRMTLVSSSAERKNKLITAIEKQMKKEWWDAYWPYISRKRDFDIRNVTDLLGKNFKSAPLVDEIFLGKLLAYAIKEEFGRK